MNLIILRGIPGSGKSTFIKNNHPDAKVCSADHYFTEADGTYTWNREEASQAHEECKLKCERYMSNKEKKIIIDNTNIHWYEMEPYIHLSEEYNYSLSFIRIDANVEDAIKRNIHDVPPEVIRRMAMNMEKIDGEIIIKNHLSS